MEITANALQTVAANQDVLFTNTVICGNNSMVHRQGSGLVSLRGLTNCQNRARFRAIFSGNIGLPVGATVGPVSLTLAIDGEPVSSTSMIITPTAAGTLNNVASAIFIEVPKGCCEQISVKNTSTVPISVQNANLIIERVA